jgi:hypothetical protein
MHPIFVFTEKNEIGLSTSAPTPTSLASTASLNCFVKSGVIKIGPSLKVTTF